MEDVLKKLIKNLNNKSIKWPRNIKTESAEGAIHMYLNNPYLNMQHNNACFEGWIIALKYHLNIENFVLDWKKDDGIKNNKDYNRFLFRVHKFEQMFKNSFKIHESKAKEVSDFIEKLNSGSYLLNEPSKEKEYSVDKSKISENYIEGLFVTKYSGLLNEKSNSNKIYSQLPVGVFKEEVKNGTEVFNRNNSALDLWGINDETKTISIFELKYNNIMIGIVSELLFYMYVLEELCISKNGLFNYLDTKKSFRGAENFKDNKKYDSLKGYFLTDRLHPLITKEYINGLNEGLKNLGHLKIENIVYRYYDDKIEITN